MKRIGYDVLRGTSSVKDGLESGVVRLPLLSKLMLILVMVPLLDMGTIVLMSHYVGGWLTFGSIVACGVLGAFLVRREGIRAWNSLHNEIGMGVMPAAPLLDAVLVLVSGVLLMTPGPLTDILGLILLIPTVRNGVRLILRAKVESMLFSGAARVVRQRIVR
jgi:UPF0716 protein FxsA